MDKLRAKGDGLSVPQVEYKVITVSELDRMVFEQLVNDDAARPDPRDPAKYIVTRRELAQSSIVMPKVLDSLGRDGWLLTAINKMECYIFARPRTVKAIEYKVMTPVDLDRMAIELLEGRGALKLRNFEGDAPTLEVVDSAAARIQNVLPAILALVAGDRWRLCAVSGPQLYFFSRTRAVQANRE